MAIKIPVVDRVSTYPGRVVLTPVANMTNTYDMERADVPLIEGTPVDKALFDNKAYTLSESVTVYVSKTGSDVNGNGTNVAPYATIQKAIDSIPKCLGGFIATVDIADGTYSERVRVEGFYGGRLNIGVSGRAVTVQGISVFTSEMVRLNISNLTSASGDTDTPLYVGQGSNVAVVGVMTINGRNTALYGVAVEQNSSLVATVNLTVNNTTTSAILANSGGSIACGRVLGSGNAGAGLRAETGGTIAYNTSGMTAATNYVAVTGGRVYGGSQTSVPNY